MTEINIWDNNTPMIKKILKQNFPKAVFKVKTERYAGGKTIHIYTDLIKEIDYNRKRELEMKLEEEGLTIKEWGELTRICMMIEENRKIEAKIKDLLKDFWQVHYDELTGEILQGINCFLCVESIERA
ncbi:hypothetical protein DRN75_03865 [Nanoarchaeota archaeon]|nr:MAG: hypothetical protein DRN75_03865 [Nanoarchaeota archaeon]